MAIAIIGMFDEREDILRLIKEKIEEKGQTPLLIDISIGTGGIKTSLHLDVTNEEIASQAGATIEEVRSMVQKERDKAVSIMGSGLLKKVKELYEKGTIEGLVVVAGMTGTFISLETLRSLPFGFPKVLVSSVASMPAYATKFSEYFGVNDVFVMNTVVDTVGMNHLIRMLATNAASAICGMVEAKSLKSKPEKKMLALTEFGFCEKGAYYVRELLKEKFECVSFHAVGLGDKAAVNLAKQGTFSAFLDMVPAGFSEYLFGGNRAAGPDRLRSLETLKIPYILTPCGFDMISCGPYERKDKNDPLWVTRKLSERKLFIQDAMRVQARTSKEEMEEIGYKVAEELNRYKYKEMVKFLIPKKGFSSISVEGGPLYDPESDEAFIKSLKKHIDPGIKVYEVETHINTMEFAQAMVKALFDALGDL